MFGFSRSSPRWTTADYSAQVLNRYVKELEACYAKYDEVDQKKGRASTLYYLTQHLDRQKTKKK